MLAMAKLKLASGKPAKAFSCAQKAWRLCGNEAIGAKAVRLMSKAQLERERFAEAVSLVQQQAAAFKNRMAEGFIVLALADVHLAMGRPKEALKAAVKADALFTKTREKAGRLSSLQMIAGVNLQLDGAPQTAGAMKAAEEALVLSREVGDTREESTMFLLISSVHRVRLEHDDAYAFARGAADLARQENHKKEEAAAMREIAIILQVIEEESEQVVQIGREAMDLSHHIGDWLGEIAARLLVAKAYKSDGLSNFAIETLDTALFMARELNDRRQIHEVLQTIVEIHSPEIAMGLVLDEVSLASAAGDRKREAIALQMLVGFHLGMDKPGDALNDAEHAVQLMAAARDVRGQALALRLLAEVHTVAKRHADALASANDAKILFQKAGDITGAVTTMEFISSVQTLKGSDKEALKAYTEQRSLFKAAGWKHEEASVLLSIAALHNRSGTAAKEAIKAATDAVALFHELDDKVEEANSMLELANLQFSCLSGQQEKLRTVQAARQAEALRTIKAARELFRSVGHAPGEAQALQVAADVHLAQGSAEEAKKVTQEALNICQTIGDPKGEADALRAMATVHRALVQKDVDDGLKPDPDAIDEAVQLATESLEAFETLGDAGGQISAWLQLSKLYVLARNGKSALQSAKESLELSQKEREVADNGPTEGTQVLALAEAYVCLRKKRAALKAAEQARSFFENVHDKVGIREVTRVCDVATALADQSEEEENRCLSDHEPIDLDAEDAPHTMPDVQASQIPEEGPVTWEVPLDVPNAPQEEAGEEDEELKVVMEVLEAQAAVDEAAERRRNKLLYRPHTQSKADLGQPDQNLRKRQLLAAASRRSKQDVSAEVDAGSQQMPGQMAGEEPSQDIRKKQVLLAAQPNRAGTIQLSSSGGTKGMVEVGEQEHKLHDKPSPAVLAQRIRPGGAFSNRAGVFSSLQAGDFDCSEQAGELSRRPGTFSALREGVERDPVFGGKQSNQELQIVDYKRREDPAPPRHSKEMKQVEQSLSSILQTVRPDWTAKDLVAVKDKLAKISIDTPAVLCQQLAEEGAQGVNARLKLAGQKCLRVDTLEALRDYGKKLYGHDA